MSKSKYVEIATRKVISSYGGVGSIYETTKGAVMIEPFETWDFIHFGIEKYIRENDNDNLNKHTICDARLVSRLRSQFKLLDRLIRVPENTSQSSFTSDPADKVNVIKATYFPEWFYCNKCNSLKHVSEWYKEWKQALGSIHIDEKEESFQEPKCAFCYLKLRDSKRYPSKVHFNPSLCLEQVRFIMTAPNGEVRDLPWDRWNKAIKGNKDEDGGKILLDFDHLCCENQDLKYIKSETFEDYGGVRIKCRHCGKENSLSGLFGLQFRVSKDDNNVFYKPVLRSSNSVYYPIIFNSIFIPISEHEGITEDNRNLVQSLAKMGRSAEDIATFISMEEKDVKNILGIDVEPTIETEAQYRLREYEYILNDHNELNDDFISEQVVVDQTSVFQIQNLTKIKRLKMTSVQTGYTRQEPYDKDEFLRDGSTSKVKYTSGKENATRYLPAVESYGEGIFIVLNQESIKQWYKNNQKDIDERIHTIRRNVSDNPKQDSQCDITDYHFAKRLLLHTLSHVLMKELEFLCGYPTTSLCERLYEDETNMQGILIYTIAGAEGSYGGLVSQGSNERFGQLMRSALIRACDCASDPVCYHSDSQGVGGRNLAACYSCVLLPENACELYNGFLDRAVLIDDAFGFFRKIILDEYGS